MNAFVPILANFPNPIDWVIDKATGSSATQPAPASA